MKTYFPKTDEIVKDWYLINAEGATLGRLAAQIAMMLRGKTKPTFTPHTDVGDFVVVINAEKVTMTGNKMTDKEYIRHTGYPGGQRIVKADELMKKHPVRLVEYAVKGMLPKNRLGSAIFRNLYVYEGPTHKHEAQQPKLIDLKTIK